MTGASDMCPPSLATNDPVREEQLPAALGCSPVIAAQRPVPGEPYWISPVKSSILERNVRRIGDVFAL